MLKVLEQAIARVGVLPEDRQRAAAEALDHIVTGTPAGPVEAYPGVDLHWPASAIWRPGEPAINTIGLADLRDALKKGWEDFAAVPSHAIFLCIIYPIIGIILFRLSFGYEVLPLVYPLLAGFTLVGPFAAVGLYELSRRRELGLDASPSHVFDVFHLPSLGSIFVLGVALMAIFFAWLAVAQLIYQQIFGSAVPASVGEFLNEVLTTQAGWQLILVGNGVGFVFAALVLVISVVSFPMLVDRNVGAATAVRTSVRAVLENPVTMAVWGLIVATALLLGSLPFFFGLAVVFPLLGHSTWHLYRKVVAT
ncbi:DUF2189 domain-containing protein [Hyphomicrobium sp. CS1GBMeth3]|uniref:DUF2189 domain-containing protein n=1 Tax=Hyphomicrobium sp. CS1GBMeth3 TaxID=1892845 RepID=UPI0009FAC0D6|nr:DUF2189 domain-containing protein [Hyphomicrobium sp. CS1GBMeth3]